MEQNIVQDTGRAAEPARAKKGISGCTLKMIAVITMLIDHTAAGVLGRYLSMSGYGSIYDIDSMNTWLDTYGALYTAYTVMRMIGRVAFPIYCFLLVQGYEHTRSRTKYALRLFLFALISELPFDLLFNGKVLEFGYQNVFFTLWIGLLTMMAFEWVESQQRLHSILRVLGMIAVLVAGLLAAHFLQTDYAATGVMCIMALYIFRWKKSYQIIAGCVAFLWELTAPLAFIPIGFYNGRRGRQIKYFFYAFYPVHLLVLYLICMALGVAEYPAM